LFRSVSGDGKNGAFAGKPNLRIVSWMSMPAHEADFGWGKPFHFGTAYVAPYDNAIILMSPVGDGSVIVCMHFQVELMQLFKKFFYGDLYDMFTAARL
jgi:shikimate O-hydroxycinnamoyltransferase